jgi:ankyrin repeat protein
MSNSALKTRSFSPGSPIKRQPFEGASLMSNQLRSLDRITIPKPCDADWDSMVGNDQVRFCEHCNLHVNNLSSMTRMDAMRLVARSKGRICVRYLERPGGGVLTRKMPEKLYRISRRVSRIAAGAFTATLSLSSAAAQTRATSTVQTTENVELVKTDHDREIVVDEFVASVSGTVKSAAGELVVDATIVLVDRESGEERFTTSSNLGQYSFQFLPQADYLLWVRKPTFRTAREVLKVEANSSVRQDIELEKRMIYSLGGAMAGFSVEEEPLLKAITDGDLDMVRTLAFAPPKFGRIARATWHLPDAVRLGNRQIVEVLLAAGADPNFRGNGNEPALMSLTDKATPELVHDLLLAGATLNTRDDYGDNALMIAAGSSDPVVLKELLGAGAQLNATNSAGETALFAAARNNGSEALVLLLEGGVNMNAQNENGETAFMAMLSNGAFENFKTLIDRGADTGLVNYDGKTALMLAAENEDPRLAKLLIEMNADVSLKDSNGESALIIAAEAGREQTVALLGRAGADLDARNADGDSALMKAANRGSVECVKELLNAGADFTVKNSGGQTILALAREAKNDQLVALLKSRGAPE